MKLRIQLYSYFKEIAGAPFVDVELSEAATVSEMLDEIGRLHPRLGEARRSTLVAVGVEYASQEQTLKQGDEVSLFPPVQGG